MATAEIEPGEGVSRTVSITTVVRVTEAEDRSGLSDAEFEHAIFEACLVEREALRHEIKRAARRLMEGD